jgi:hypothetical protein
MAQMNQGIVFTSRAYAPVPYRAYARVYIPLPPCACARMGLYIHKVSLKRFHIFGIILPQVVDFTQFFFYKKFFAKKLHYLHKND